MTDAYINTRLNPKGGMTYWGALQKCWHLICFQHLLIEATTERASGGKKYAGRQIKIETHRKEKKKKRETVKKQDRNRGETSQKIEKMMPGRDVKKEQDKWEKSGAQCGGGRAWVDRKSNRMKLNERESEEKSAANEWQGYQGSAEHSTSCTGSQATAEIKRRSNRKEEDT